MDEILNSPPRTPRQVNRKFSPKLEEIILKCLEKDPEDRYQTVKEIAVDLRRMTAPSSASQRLVASQPNRLGMFVRFLWAAIPFLVLGIFMIGWAYLPTTFFNPVRSIPVLSFCNNSKAFDHAQLADSTTVG